MVRKDTWIQRVPEGTGSPGGDIRARRPIARAESGSAITGIVFAIFGVAMGIGYDWFHDLLTSAQETPSPDRIQSPDLRIETGRTETNGVPQSRAAKSWRLLLAAAAQASANGVLSFAVTPTGVIQP